MDENHQKAQAIFSPYYIQKKLELTKNDVKFVQYTSAEAAKGIIENEVVWLRNSQCMNDYSEVQHGLNCLLSAYHGEQKSTKFQEILDNIFPGVTGEFANIFDSWVPNFQSSTFIACVSEHPHEEDLYGRLSMWRAYGGDRPVALVLNTCPFLAETDIFHAYVNPVSYLDPENVGIEFDQLISRIEENKEFLSYLGKEAVVNYLFNSFKHMVLCVKHPGFREEREWRVIYNPEHSRSQYLGSSIETICGVPQEVHKLPLKNIPEGNFFGASIPELVEKIIIGPNDQQGVLGKAFESLLKSAGCYNPSEKIRYSRIPLR